MIPIRDTRPSYRFSWITVTLITINVAVFIFQLGLSTDPTLRLDITQWKDYDVIPLDYQRFESPRLTEIPISPRRKFIFRFGVVPGEISNLTDFPPYVPFPIYLTLISSTFLHGGFFHLLGNMLFLWIFGDNVEDAMGPVRFLAFYFLAAVGGGLLQIVANSSSGTPMVGASGAIAGVMAAYLLLYPDSRIITLVPIFFFFTFVQIPAFLMIGFWFLFELIRAAGQPTGQVAHLAHIGGFLTGAFLTPYFKSSFIKIRLWDYFK